MIGFEWWMRLSMKRSRLWTSLRWPGITIVLEVSIPFCILDSSTLSTKWNYFYRQRCLTASWGLPLSYIKAVRSNRSFRCLTECGGYCCSPFFSWEALTACFPSLLDLVFQHSICSTSSSRRFFFSTADLLLADTIIWQRCNHRRSTLTNPTYSCRQNLKGYHRDDDDTPLEPVLLRRRKRHTSTSWCMEPKMLILGGTAKPFHQTHCNVLYQKTIFLAE